MSVGRTEKLKSLLDAWLPQSVVTSAYLRERGISPQHTQKYLASGWIEAVGGGAFKRKNDRITWEGALYSLQEQAGLVVHVGATTALAASGAQHYLRLGRESGFLFSAPGVALPLWFRRYDWGADISHTQTKLLPPELGLSGQNHAGFRVTGSSPERAILEALHLAPAKLDLVECYQLMEGLQNLRPKLMQELLEFCNSVKVKRLFLFMAEKAHLPVLKHLDVERIALGSGARALVNHGFYDSKYHLILPKELAP